jgi:DinB superfamily
LVYYLPFLAISAILAILMNPFSLIASDLGRTVAQAKPLLLKLDNADTSTRPAPDKWAKKEILGHLLDSASNNHQRFVRATLQGISPFTFPGYDQNSLVDLQRFTDVDWNFLVDFWTSYNRFLAHVINSLPAEAAAITCHIGNNPPATLEWIAADYVAHLKHHLNQVLGQTFETSYGKA